MFYLSVMVASLSVRSILLVVMWPFLLAFTVVSALVTVVVLMLIKTTSDAGDDTAAVAMDEDEVARGGERLKDIHGNRPVLTVHRLLDVGQRLAVIPLVIFLVQYVVG